MTPFNGRAIVSTVGKPVQLSEFPRLAATVTVAALAANTGVIHIGGPSVRATDGEANGLPMSGGTRPDMWTGANVDLSHIWIDAAVANEGVSFLAMLL